MYEISVICTIVTMVVILAVLMKNKPLQADNGEWCMSIEPRQERIYRLLVFLGILLMAVTRAYKLGVIPGGMNQDEAMAAVDALALSQYGTDRFGVSYPVHFTAWGYSQMSVLLSYLMIPFIKLGGFHILSVRLPMLVFSLLGGIALFLLTKDVAGKSAGLIILYMTAVNPWHFMQSRWALDCNLFPHMFIIGLYFLYKGFKKGCYIYAAMFFFALCMYCYGVAFYMVPFFLLAACVVMNKMKLITLRQSLKAAGFYFLFSWPIYLTMMINAMGWQSMHFFGLTLPYFPDSVRSGDILFFSREPGKQLLSNLRSLLWVVFRQDGDSIWNALDYFGTIYWCTMPFVFVGLVCVIQSIRNEDCKEKKAIAGLFLIYWACGLFTGLFIANVNVNRINIIFYSQLIFAALGIEYVIIRSKRALPIICGVYLCMSTAFAIQYGTVYAESIKGIFFEDFMEAVEEAGNLNSDRFFIALADKYDEAANCAEILTLYGQQIDALYFQGKTDTFQGKEINYKERYYYRIPRDEEIDEAVDTVYVLRKEQRERFGADRFEIREFGDFILVKSR